MKQYDVLKTSLLVYLFSCFVFWQAKSPCMFYPNGEFKPFGLKSNQTITPFWLVTSLIGITAYYLQIVNKSKIF